MSTYSAIAALLGGISEGQSNLRQRQEREAQLAQQAADRKRQQDLQNYQFATEEAQRLGAGGNLAGAYPAILRALDAANAFDGGNRVGPKLIGTTTTGDFSAKLPSAAAKFLGTKEAPTIGAKVSHYDPTKIDFANKSNSAVLNAYLGIKPSLQEVSPGASIYSVGPDGKATLSATAPYPENPYKLTAEEQKALKREGIQATGARQDKTIAAAGARQDKSLAASTERQTRTLGAQDAKVWAQHVRDFGASFPGVTITSTTRTPEHNAEVGGVPGSYHTLGMAFDAVPPKDQIPALQAWGASRGMQVIVEDLNGPNYHVHFEPMPGVRPAPPAKNNTPKLVTDAHGVRVKDGEGVVVGKKGATARKPKAWTPSDEKTVLELAAKEFPFPGEQYGMAVPPEIQAKRKRYATQKKAEFMRQGDGESGGSALDQLLQMMDEDKARRKGDAAKL